MNKFLQANRCVIVGLLFAMGGASASAQYEPAKLPDPTRRWSVNLGARGEWDDNIFTTSSNETASLKASVNPELLFNLPLEQTFLGFRYGYEAVYYENRPTDDIDQTHRFDFLFSHSFSPRLVLDLNDRVRFGVEPELVELQAGDEVVTRRRGDYFYNEAGMGLQYDLSPRWRAGLDGNHEYWDFDTMTASINDRSQYHGTLSATYLLNPRTTLGANYRFGVVDYRQPGPDDERNSISHYGYASLSRSFTPRLSGKIDGGVEYREFGDDDNQLGPFVDTSLSYAYAEGSAVSAGFSYAITTTEVIGFRSTETATFFARLSHRFTPKLSAGANALFAFSQYENPTAAGPVANVEDELLGAGIYVRYAFTKWFSAEAGYNYDRVFSDDTVREFDRNRVHIGARVTY